MRTPYQHIYQIFLIIFSVMCAGLLIAFFLRELFPEYREYQSTYVALEAFRAEVTDSEPPPFKKGIKQILFYSEKPGPESLDRCVSCHVATTLEQFSKRRIARDINGQIRVDASGQPLLEPNPNFVFAQLKEVDEKRYRSLRFQRVGGLHVDMERVLAAHPLIGRETRPFEYHPLDTYGCTTCHSGNGRSVNAKRAHGPVFDEMYEAGEGLVVSPYVEVDRENDPLISKVYNYRPSHDLIFQTQPLLPGPLMDARCVKCHLPSKQEMQSVVAAADVIGERKERAAKVISQGVKGDIAALTTAMQMRLDLQTRGLEATAEHYRAQLENPTLTAASLDSYGERLNLIASMPHTPLLLARLNEMALNLLGSSTLVQRLSDAIAKEPGKLDALVAKAAEETTEGPIAAKRANLSASDKTLQRLHRAIEPFAILSSDKRAVSLLASEADEQLTSFKRGYELFFSQGCYGCHRIEGLTRGGIGPDLSEIGLSYPWYVKLSIVWPQGKLKSSAMPNMKLDHEEVEDLLAYLMAQTGDDHVVSDVDREMRIKAFEAGKKLWYEQPLPPSEIRNLRTSMTVFATQGCAACHKLRGFEGNVTYAGAPEEIVGGRLWFYRRFPQWMSGAKLVSLLEKHGDEIDKHLVTTDAKGTILQTLDAEYPGTIQSYYTPFRYAARVNPSAEWQERLQRVLTMYIQEYGLGRDLAPRVSWSGVWRDDEWLTGHFLNPTAYTPRSIMPVMPFDMTKFYALNYMLHTLGRKNRDAIEEIWQVKGFNPELAFTLLCAACHGINKQGNGPVAEIIYPLPKNLRNAEFLKNLTREQAILSVTHGVQGTPMPPWGEAVPGERPVLQSAQVEALVDWIFESVPGGPVTPSAEVPVKWEYSALDVAEELQAEGEPLKAGPTAGPGTTLSSLLASIDLPAASKKEIERLFNVSPAPFPDREHDFYTIKKEYYTIANLRAGEALFEENCKHCHGSEGMGNGPRAETMLEAKPRMLANLPWIQSRDDLRLLRAIKFGVPGTAMLPWGDRTSVLQRMQLVMYIRSLSEETERRDRLNSALYNAFDTAVLAIERCRIKEYEALEEVKGEWETVRQRREALSEEVERGEPFAEEAAAAYQRELELQGQLKAREARDKILQRLIEAIRKERTLYSDLGDALILKRVDSGIMEDYTQWIASRAQNFDESDRCVAISRSEQERKETKRLQEKIVKTLDARIEDYADRIAAEKAKIRSGKTEEVVKELMEEMGGMMNLKTKFLFEVHRADELQAEQRQVYDEYLTHGS